MNISVFPLLSRSSTRGGDKASEGAVSTDKHTRTHAHIETAQVQLLLQHCLLSMLSSLPRPFEGAHDGPHCSVNGLQQLFQRVILRCARWSFN